MSIFKRVLAKIDQFFAAFFVVVLVFATFYSFFGATSMKEARTAEREKQNANAVPRHKDLLLYDAVSKVNVEIAVMMLSPYLLFGMDDPAPCLVAKSIDLSLDPSDSIAIKMAADFRQQCQFTLLARHSTFPVYQEIVAKQALPPKLLTFEAYHEEQWVKVGVFASAEDCEATRTEATTQGIGTRACSEWHPSF